MPKRRQKYVFVAFRSTPLAIFRRPLMPLLRPERLSIAL